MSATVGQKLFFFLQQRTTSDGNPTRRLPKLRSCLWSVNEKEGEEKHEKLFAGGQVNKKGELLQLKGQIHGNHTDVGRQPKHSGSKIQ
jgi:hypothetical protein